MPHTGLPEIPDGGDTVAALGGQRLLHRPPGAGRGRAVGGRVAPVAALPSRAITPSAPAWPNRRHQRQHLPVENRLNARQDARQGGSRPSLTKYCSGIGPAALTVVQYPVALRSDGQAVHGPFPVLTCGISAPGMQARR